MVSGRRGGMELFNEHLASALYVKSSNLHNNPLSSLTDKENKTQILICPGL